MKIERGDTVQHRRGGSEGTAMHAAENGTVNVKVKGGTQAWAFADIVKETPAAKKPAAASPPPAKKKKAGSVKKKVSKKKATPVKKKVAKKKSK